MLKNIVFDMGNVLLQYNPKRFIERHTDDPQHQQLLLQELFSSVEWVSMDRGTLSEEETYEQVSKRIPPILHPILKSLLESWFEDLHPMPGMATLIEELKAKDYKLYLLSNTGQSYYKYRHIIPGIEHFEGEFISSDHELLKPSKAIYQKFCETFKLESETCLFIDDSAANAEGAQRVGMKTIVFHGDVCKLRTELEKWFILETESSL